MRLTHIIFATLLSSAAISPASAVSFQLYNGGGFNGNTAALKSFTVAMDYWSSVLTDDVTVNIVVGAQAFINDAPITTQASVSSKGNMPIEWVYEALAADSKSALDDQAVANLQPLTPSTSASKYDTLTVVANSFNNSKTGYVDDSTRIDDDASANNVYTYVNPATAKAMNLEAVSGTVLDDTLIDGTVIFSTKVNFDYDPTDGIDEGSYDYTALAIQAIGTTLGLDSGVWQYESYTSDADRVWRRNFVENTTSSRTIDLFRYSESSTIDWSTSSSDRYFSIDGGESELFGESSLGTGVTYGNGVGQSYWKDTDSGDSLGIMDGTISTGTDVSVSALDLAALDAIGWDLNFDVLTNSDYSMSTADIYRAMTAVPEPSTWLQMILGFGMIGGVARYRRPAARRHA